MKRWFVIVRPWMIQWSHSELVEWAQIASNYEETTYHAEEVMFDYSQKEEIKSPGTGEKVTKWPPTSEAKAWACSKVLLYGKFQ